MIARLALGNLRRNTWRTGLTVGSIAVGVALLIWTLAYMEGFRADMVRKATSIDLGQVQISTPDYLEQASARHSFTADAALLDSLLAHPHVVAASPRLRVFGLVGNEQRSVVAQLVGVDPEREAAALLVDDSVVEGRWLGDAAWADADAIDSDAEPPPREAVVGEGVARQLDIGLGDELVIYFEAADGSLGNDLVEIVGVVRTGNPAIDRRGVYLNLSDLQFVGALDGQAHEIALRLDDVTLADPVAAALGAELADPLVARSWREAIPQIAQLLDVSGASDLVMLFIVYLLVAFGLLNAQRMSALERHREFGVMMAIGVTPGRLFNVVVLESLFLGVIGATIGAVLGVAVSAYFVVYGLDLGVFGMEGDISYMGVTMSKVLYFELTPRAVLEPVIFVLPVAIVCGLWPAATSARLDVTAALSGRSQ